MSCANYTVHEKHLPLHHRFFRHGFLLSMLGVVAFWSVFAGILYFLL